MVILRPISRYHVDRASENIGSEDYPQIATTATDGNTKINEKMVWRVIVSRLKTKMLSNIVKMGLHEMIGITVTSSPVISAWLSDKTATANNTPPIMNQSDPEALKVSQLRLTFSAILVPKKI